MWANEDRVIVCDSLRRSWYYIDILHNEFINIYLFICIYLYWLSILLTTGSRSPNCHGIIIVMYVSYVGLLFFWVIPFSIVCRVFVCVSYSVSVARSERFISAPYPKKCIWM